jgi:hypothetical protein
MTEISMINLSKKMELAIETIEENLSVIEERGDIDVEYELGEIEDNLKELKFYANIIADIQDSDDENHSQANKENVND